MLSKPETATGVQPRAPHHNGHSSNGTGHHYPDATTYAVALFNSKTDKRPQQQKLAWAQLVEKLTTQDLRPGKDGPLWSPTLYLETEQRAVELENRRKAGNASIEAGRAKENVAAVSCLVLDFDNGTPPDAFCADWQARGLAYVVHSTHSHTPEHPKWRVAFGLSVPVDAVEWPRVYGKLAASLGGGHVDPQCKDASRIYYLPSCAPGASDNAFAFAVKGEALDPNSIPDVEEPPAPIATPLGAHLNSSHLNGNGTSNGASSRAYVLAALRRAREEMLTLTKGQRHERRLKSAHSLAGYLHTGHITEGDITDALSVNFGEDKSSALQAIHDGIVTGKQKPKDVPPPSIGYGKVRIVGGTSAHEAAPADAPPDGKETKPITLTLGYPLTDTGNAERHNARYGSEFLHSETLGNLIWDGQRWAPDEMDQVFEWGKTIVRSIYAEAAHADDDDRPKIAAWAKASESLPRRKAMIEIAGKDGAKARSGDFDRDPWQFNVENGTLDLKTGALLPHARAAKITKLASVHYDPKATCPSFMEFLAAVLDYDVETAEFLQRFFGYTLTGSTREQCFLILHGDGSNGKSTLLNVLRWLLGDYCKQTKPDTLMKKQFGDGIPNDVAMLRGARMVTAIETNEGRQFDEGKIKEMTGGDPVTARFFRKEFFEFVPEFKLYLATNHKPQIVGDDIGIWRRVRLVPFNVHFWNPDRMGETGPDHLRADKTLGEKLRAELPGILNWALTGCLEWQRNGLPEPKAVAEATETYRSESDPVEAFLSECCFRAAHCETPNAHIYEHFKKWAEREEETELSNKAFTARMKLKGFENTRGTGGLRRWKGVGLLDLEGVQK